MDLALFDFDGTITRDDTWTAFLKYSATRGRLAAAVLLLTPVMIGYRLGLVSARAARPLVSRVAFQGRNSSVVRELGRTYARARLPLVVRQHAIDRIEWHKRRGDTVVVVSASLDVYLRSWCESVGIDVICTELEESDGRLTGRYLRGDCCGAEKVRRIRECYDLARYRTIYAYGDSEEDRDLLAIAHERYYRWRRVDAPDVVAS